MFSTHLDHLTLYSCLSNIPSPQLHELRRTCRLFDSVARQIFRSREYECKTNEMHTLLYQPCCKYFGKLTSGDRTRFIRIGMTTEFTAQLDCLEVIQLWNVISTSELFSRLASALSRNNRLQELYLTSFPFKMEGNDTSDKIYSALSGHCGLRRIMIRPHQNTPEFVDACTKWKELEFIFIEISSDEEVSQFVRFAGQVPTSLLALAIHINSTSIAQLTIALSTMTHLRKLSVGCVYYPKAADRTAFFQALACLKHLEVLNINWNLGLYIVELFAILSLLPRFKRLQIANDIALAPIPKKLSFEVLSLSTWNLASTDQWVYLF